MVFPLMEVKKKSLWATRAPRSGRCGCGECPVAPPRIRCRVRHSIRLSCPMRRRRALRCRSTHRRRKRLVPLQAQSPTIRITKPLSLWHGPRCIYTRRDRKSPPTIQ